MKRISIMVASLLLSSGWATALSLDVDKILTSSIEYVGGPKVVLTLERLTDSQPGSESFPGPAKLVRVQIIFSETESVEIPHDQFADIILPPHHNLRIDSKSDNGDLEFSVRIQDKKKVADGQGDSRITFIIKGRKYSSRRPELEIPLNIPNREAEQAAPRNR